ncbi:MAG: aldose 1-epimerase [Psychromonas sp.]|jgi:aldose 1-epimerase|uniref:aldose 1-epimerase n=1 Tax=Psychromonas sp. TaxID=1884585 RepID=UPI0039E69972
MFTINIDKFSELDCINIENKAQGIELQIIHGFGAIINKFIVNNSPFSFIQGYQSGQELKDTNPFFSRSAKLFPFVNRLNNGCYHYQNSEYQLPANFPWSDQHAVHGLLYDQAFKIVEQQANADFAQVRVCFESKHLHEGFPFSIKLEIDYKIEADGQLTCHTDIVNTGLKTFPFADGFHPYFNLGQPLQNCLIQIPSCQHLETTDDLPNGQVQQFTQFVNATSLADITLNDCYQFSDNTNRAEAVKIELSCQNKKSSISYWQNDAINDGYRFIQLYTPSDEDSIAIEPMTSPADAFNNKISLQELNPRESISLVWGCQASYLAELSPAKY